MKSALVVADLPEIAKYIRQIYRKLNVSSRAEAARRGLVRP